MLYIEKNIDFTQLVLVLKSVGFSDSTIEIGIRYMSEDTADETLLDELQPIKARNAVSFEHQRMLEYINNKLFAKNEELYLRYVNFIFSASAMSGSSVIFQGLYSGAHKKAEVRIKALKRRFGDEAEAIELALRAYYHHEMVSKPRDLEINDPALCIKAIEMLDKYGSGSDHLAKTELCIFALNNTPLPEEDGSVIDSPIVKTAVDTLIEAYENAGKLKAEQYNFMTVGMAAAAPFSEKAKQLFKLMSENNLVAAAQLERSFIDPPSRMQQVIESMPEIIDEDYIRFLAERKYTDLKERLGKIAAFAPKMFLKVLDSETNLKTAVLMQDVLAENDPDFDPKEFDLKSRIQRRAARILESYSSDNPKLIRDYLNGNGSYADIKEIFSGYRSLNDLSGGSRYFDYFGTFGVDDFFKRIFTIAVIANAENYRGNSNIFDNTGHKPFNDDIDNEKRSMQYMLDAGAPLTDVISYMGLLADGAYGSEIEAYTNSASKAAAVFKELLDDCEPKNMSVRGRMIYTRAIGSSAEHFRKKLSDLTEDGSKAVRADVLNVFKAHKELADEVKTLLAAKKMAKREIAVSIIEAWGTEGFGDELQKALNSEKNDKLKLRIASLIGSESAAAAAKVAPDDMIKKLMKGASKLEWLYTKPFGPVHRTDGTIADEDYLKVIMLCYASMKKPGRNNFAIELAEVLDKKELELFAQEVFNRWYEKGAEAKTKWVLYFSAIHGGSDMFHKLVEHINEWGNYSVYMKKAIELYMQDSNTMISLRTSIAGEAVMAIAMNGSREALMIVDNISRKFNGKSVRTAAVNAMASAADGLGITAEELADRIVPDLGFDKNLCRVFDYGKRQFSVYIRPSLELEIFSGDKKIKSMPKPGAADDAAKANAAYEQFKEMKKVMKSAMTLQKQRLEYVLMCDRKWSTEGWRTLFVENAIMHCFAIGLIWGIYEDGKLSTTFRYMDDGSFTTSDGDEFELPANAVIGLVHPIELSEELKAEWTEQLSDYEIVQPFQQLSRPVFTPEPAELEIKRLTRFKGCEVGNISLTGKMTRFGWEKGQAEDGGYFYYFTREDASSRSVALDGRPLLTGYGTLMIHSGMYMAAYHMEEESVTVEDIAFFKAGTSPDYGDKDDKCFIKCSEVPQRYFSEIMLQLTSVLGGNEKS
ncbi:MAG: DUF4132 domain-containing protein [Ruminococcus sp.]|nr:DUF4132 domain-containing protein [Ruminococcus sp.]